MDDSGYGYLLIFLIGAVVYFTKIAGAELMSLFDMTSRLEAVLRAMASSVLLAIVVSAVAGGTLREGLSVGVAAVAMLVSGNALIAMSGGILAAALFSMMST